MSTFQTTHQTVLSHKTVIFTATLQSTHFSQFSYLQLGGSAWNPITGSPQSKVFFNGSTFWSPSDTKSETESPPCHSTTFNNTEPCLLQMNIQVFWDMPLCKFVKPTDISK
jgi:hypothetical protein